MNSYVEIKNNYDSESDEAKGRISKKTPLLAVFIVNRRVAEVKIFETMAKVKKHFKGLKIVDKR